MVDRTLNFLLSFLVIGVFIFSADGSEHLWWLSGGILAALASFGAFLSRQLTLDGMFAAIVAGTITFGIGGVGAAFILLLFFLSSAILSYTTPSAQEDLPLEVRRNGLQVWANSFWFVIFLIFNDIFAHQFYLIGAAAAVSTATADTWATELGSQEKSSTFLITNGAQVTPGTDGGVSVKGTGAALAGSFIIAVLSIYVFSLQLHNFIYIFIGGFSGCLIDSYLGALYERQEKMGIDNNIVNSLSTGGGALLALILKGIFI